MSPSPATRFARNARATLFAASCLGPATLGVITKPGSEPDVLDYVLLGGFVAAVWTAAWLCRRHINRLRRAADDDRAPTDNEGAAETT